MAKTDNEHATTFSDEELALLRALVESKGGVAAAARALDVARGTLQAALGNVALREGTVMLVRARLAGVSGGGGAA